MRCRWEGLCAAMIASCDDEKLVVTDFYVLHYLQQRTVIGWPTSPSFAPPTWHEAHTSGGVDLVR
jgi:hypothetical protein